MITDELMAALEAHAREIADEFNAKTATEEVEIDKKWHQRPANLKELDKLEKSILKMLGIKRCTTSEIALMHGMTRANIETVLVHMRNDGEIVFRKGPDPDENWYWELANGGKGSGGPAPRPKLDSSTLSGLAGIKTYEGINGLAGINESTSASVESLGIPKTPINFEKALGQYRNRSDSRPGNEPQTQAKYLVMPLQDLMALTAEEWKSKKESNAKTMESAKAVDKAAAKTEKKAPKKPGKK